MTASKRTYWRGSLLAGALVLLAVLWTGSRYGQLFRGFLNIKPLHIHGLAVDSEGTPLAGVKIQISWSTAWFLIGLPYDHNRTSWVTSDKNGEWTFTLEKPDQMSIRTAQKEGYAFDPLRGTRSDIVGQAAQRKLKEFPATVVMRKKKEEALLIGYRGQYDRGDLYLETVQGKSKQVSVDILAEYENRKKPEYTDLQISACFDPTNACWTLTFRAPDGHGGLVNRNELLFEAPVGGYVPEVIFKIAIKDRSTEDKNYLYLKSREQGLYTRVLYRYDSWDDPQYGLVFRVYLGTVTNPYGERSLEDAQELRRFTFARDELLQEAKKAIELGTLPKKPEKLAKHMEERDKILEEAWRKPNR